MKFKPNRMTFLFSFCLLLAVACGLSVFLPDGRAASLAMLPPVKIQFFDNSGKVLNGGKIYTYEPGTTTPKATYTSSTGVTANANPTILDSAGRANIWLNGSYKFVVNTSADVTLYTVDNVTGGGGSSSTSAQWIDSNLSPTYISTTSFSVAGDYTTTFEAGTRIEAVETAGTVYGTVTASSYGASITTVTVVLDSGTLDAGLSSVATGILTVSNPSHPIPPVVTKTNNYTLTAADIARTLFASANATNFTLAAANAVPSGGWVKINNAGGNALTLTGTVDGVANPVLNPYETMTIMSDGTSWYGSGFTARSVTGVVYGVQIAPANIYLPLYGSGNVIGPEAAVKTVMPTNGNIKNLRVYFNANTGSTNNIVTLRKNGADTALTTGAFNAATSASDTVHSVSFVAGDRLDWNYQLESYAVAAPNMLSISAIITN